MSAISIEVFVNDDDDGPSVALLLNGDVQLMEHDGQLRPVVEVSAAVALRLAAAIVECAGQIAANLPDE
jgi:hypothetical protein